MPENNVGRISGSVPSFVSIEPDASMPAPAKALVCLDRASEGAEGARGAGTEALVRRFSEASGAGGGSGYVHGAADVYDPCGGTVLLAAGTGGVGALLSGVKCLADLQSLTECLTNEDAASEPVGTP
jgi:hypothetical protein